MTDEVNLDNLDALADLPDSADTAVEADPVADAAVDSINDNAEEQPAAADDAVESDTAENDAEASGDADEQESEELDAGAKAVEEFSKSLRTLEGKWYVLHTYSGYEKRVKTNVESRVTSFGLEDKIFQIEVPMEEVDKHTDKGKKVITRVRIPGYVLIRMWPDEDARRIVRETEGVTGFVGPTKDRSRRCSAATPRSSGGSWATSSLTPWCTATISCWSDSSRNESRRAERSRGLLFFRALGLAWMA